MSVQFVRTRIRCAIDISKRTTKFKDVLTSSFPSGFRGTGQQFEISFFYGRELVDISNFSAVTVTVKDADDLTGPALMTKTVGEDNLNKTLTIEEWNAGTSQHVIVVFSSVETALGAGGEDVDYHLVVHGLTTDDTIDKDTFGVSTLRLIEDGTVDAESPPPSGPLYLNADQIKALMEQYMKKVGDPGDVQTYRSDPDVFRRIVGVDAEGNRIDALEEN
jgi:hypothetical protein